MGTLIQGGQTLDADSLDQYYGNADTSPTTVTTTGPVNLSSPYTIPALEPVAGESAYEVRCAGTGTWATGATLQNLAISLWLGGVQVTVNTNIDHTVFASAAAFRFRVSGLLVCDSTGPSGGFYGSLEGVLTQIANTIIPGTAAGNSVPFADGNAIAATVDTTSPMIVVIKCGWAGVTGAPTITNRLTAFGKIS